MFLNEVYKLMGLVKSSEGALVGWVRDEGSGVVDISISGADNGAMELTFHVDGVIYDKLPKEIVS